MLDKSSKIYVAGHHGLVGSAIWNNLMQRGYTNLVGRSHKELDLLDGAAVKAFFDAEQPEAVETIKKGADKKGAKAKFLQGLVMRETRGSADPAEAAMLIAEKLK